MRIQNNIMAMNAYRNYTTNTNAISGNLEKLSSGYKVNRAGDDAAGLAISEKMRAQITGLDVAQKNAQDGISLVQTAEGALTEVHSMLNRMYELANQSANGTYDDAVDRNNLNKEITALKDEIDRIADSANFNGINLLDGSQGLPEVTQTEGTAGSAAVTAVAQSYSFDLSAVAEGEVFEIGGVTLTYAAATHTNAAGFGDAIRALAEPTDYTWGGTGATLTLTADTAGASAADLTSSGDFTPTVVDGVDAAAEVVAVGGSTEVSFGGDVTTSTNIQAGATFTIGTTVYEAVETAGDALETGTVEFVVGANDAATLDNLVAAAGADTTVTVARNAGDVTITKADATDTVAPTASTTNMGGLTLQVGDTSADFNQLVVSIGDMHAAELGLDDIDNLSTIDISTQVGAAAATDIIKAAINQVSGTRGDLGAIQNRLDHTINNLSVMEENIQNAESAIRDTDVAEEMMAYTKNNILIQSAQAMLAQANQIPQGVLQLLG